MNKLEPDVKPRTLLAKMLGLIFLGIIINSQLSAQQLDFSKLAAVDEAEGSKAKSNQADTAQQLAGLWEAKQRFGPDFRGGYLSGKRAADGRRKSRGESLRL